jgi:ankyrin repeat protein
MGDSQLGTGSTMKRNSFWKYMSDAMKTDEPEMLVGQLQSCGNSLDLGEWLVYAAREGKVNCTSALISLGANVNYHLESGESAFSFACARNQLQIAQILFANGAMINEVSPGNVTPLDIACCWASPDFRAWLKGIGGVRIQAFKEWGWPPESLP